MKKITKELKYLSLCLLFFIIYGLVVTTLIYFTINWWLTMLGVIFMSTAYVQSCEKLNIYFGELIDKNEGFGD